MSETRYAQAVTLAKKVLEAEKQAKVGVDRVQFGAVRDRMLKEVGALFVAHVAEEETKR